MSLLAPNRRSFLRGLFASTIVPAPSAPDPLRVLNLNKAYRKYRELNNLDEDLMFK
jgi:hypothetical protein